MIYTVKESLHAHPKSAYTHIKTRKREGSSNGEEEIYFEGSILLDGHSFSQPAQKNWVVLEHKAEIYYFPSLNPLVVCKQNGFVHRNHDPNPEIPTYPYIAKIDVVHQSDQQQLPWDEQRYGGLRGGTHAMLVTHPKKPAMKLYLHFFHTVSAFKPVNFLTYFMGAMTFCPDQPFHIHSMSAHPILLPEFYQGPWTRKQYYTIDYVMFPISIFELPEDEGKYVWISMGSYDQIGWTVKFDLADLLDSLDVVKECPAVTSA
jgi:hypothetical protein